MSILRYGVTLGVTVVCDAVWLSFMFERFYKPYLKMYLRPEVQTLPIVLFYPIYAYALYVLVVEPALRFGYSYTEGAYMGCVLGLAAYGAYNCTNQAIIRDWSWIMTSVDWVWGMSVTGIVAVISIALIRYLGW